MSRRREVLLLVALLLVLAVVVAYQWRRSGDGTGPVAGVFPARAAARTQARTPTAVPAVKLNALQEARQQPPPPAPERDPFRFQVKAAPAPPPPVAMAPGGQAPGTPAVPPPPPPPPPITLKFIGVVQASNQKVAVLSDPATRDVFYGREGDIVDGRYRILRIGVESIEMAYVDGRGRQSIRLSGS